MVGTCVEAEAMGWAHPGAVGPELSMVGAKLVDGQGQGLQLGFGFLRAGDPCPSCSKWVMV